LRWGRTCEALLRHAREILRRLTREILRRLARKILRRLACEILLWRVETTGRWTCESGLRRGTSEVLLRCRGGVEDIAPARWGLRGTAGP
jgi:hypothetical protein